jgi:hypothetical protein
MAYFPALYCQAQDIGAVNKDSLRKDSLRRESPVTVLGRTIRE